MRELLIKVENGVVLVGISNIVSATRLMVNNEVVISLSDNYEKVTMLTYSDLDSAEKVMNTIVKLMGGEAINDEKRASIKATLGDVQPAKFYCGRKVVETEKKEEDEKEKIAKEAMFDMMPIALSLLKKYDAMMGKFDGILDTAMPYINKQLDVDAE
jgi:hypothetical protein